MIPVCETVTTVPTGDALVVQEVITDFNTASGTTTSGGFTTSAGGFGLYADTSAETCSGGKQFISGEPENGNVGSQSYPIVPGYVIPSHDTIVSSAPGLGGTSGSTDTSSLRLTHLLAQKPRPTPRPYSRWDAIERCQRQSGGPNSYTPGPSNSIVSRSHRSISMICPPTRFIVSPRSGAS
jgi:hypothetical protein